MGFIARVHFNTANSQCNNAEYSTSLPPWYYGDDCKPAAVVMRWLQPFRRSALLAKTIMSSCGGLSTDDRRIWRLTRLMILRG